MHAHALACALALAAAIMIVRGEYRRVREIYHLTVDHARKPYVEQIRSLLAAAPAGTWLFSNYQTPLVEQYRAAAGPTGALYTYYVDYSYPLMNGHVYAIQEFGLEPRRARPEASRWLQKIPVSWKNGVTELIGPDSRWSPSPPERRELFSRPVYLLIVRPSNFPPTGEYLDRTIMPLLERELKLKVIGREGDVTLYRATASDMK
jgi:hypothetical protein